MSQTLLVLLTASIMVETIAITWWLIDTDCSGWKRAAWWRKSRVVIVAGSAVLISSMLVTTIAIALVRWGASVWGVR